jgi:hypothetical protein
VAERRHSQRYRQGAAPPSPSAHCIVPEHPPQQPKPRPQPYTATTPNVSRARPLPRPLQVEHCCDGVACLKLLDALHPGKVPLKKVPTRGLCAISNVLLARSRDVRVTAARQVDASAKFPEDRLKNLKMLQKVLRQMRPLHLPPPFHSRLEQRRCSRLWASRRLSPSKRSPRASSRTTTTCCRFPPTFLHIPPPPPSYTSLPHLPLPHALPQFCYQHAQRIHPSTDFSAPPRPSSARPPPHAPHNLLSAANFSEGGAVGVAKAHGRGGGGRAPQGRNVAWNRCSVLSRAKTTCDMASYCALLRLDEDAHAESSFEVTLRPGHSIHPTRSLIVPPSLYPPAPHAASSSSSSKPSSDVFSSLSGDKSKAAGQSSAMTSRGWGGVQSRPQGRSVKWGKRR